MDKLQAIIEMVPDRLTLLARWRTRLNSSSTDESWIEYGARWIWTKDLESRFLLDVDCDTDDFRVELGEQLEEAGILWERAWDIQRRAWASWISIKEGGK